MLTTCASAQEITGRLVGTVVDASGAAVPAASVSATNQDTGIAIKVKTDAAGNFRIRDAIAGPVHGPCGGKRIPYGGGDR